MLLEKSIQYAEDVVRGKEITTFEVRVQCKWFLEDLKRQKDDDFKYYLNTDFLLGIEAILKLLNFATGINDIVGKSIYEGLENFQAFFITNIFGFRFKDEPYRYRYRDVVLFIARKNSKSFLAALIILILMLTEDDYSEFYSICLDRELAGEIKKAMSQIIEVSPAIDKYFKIPKTLSGKTLCSITKSTYQPRTAEANRNNSVRGCAVIVDEFGAMKNTANSNAMRSGQKSVKNPLFFKLTTAYAEDKSPMLEELEYLKKIYRGLEVNDRLFALVYYATEEHMWDDTGIYMANPLRIEKNYEEIRDSRKSAIAKPSEREEYLTKCMNHFVPTNSGEAYIDVEKLRLCKIPSFDWRGKTVYVGIDMALSNDNVSVTMLCYEKGKIYSKSWAFIPEDRIEEKNKKERTDYNRFIKDGSCFACGDQIISYSFVEDFILNLEDKYGVKIHSIGYDVSNCRSTADKLHNAGYKTVEVKQFSSVLHSPTKLLQEYILQKNFQYEENLLYEINFQNAKCITNSTLQMYINKKKSNGKVDMLASTIDALYLLEQDVLLNNKANFGVQVLNFKSKK